MSMRAPDSEDLGIRGRIDRARSRAGGRRRSASTSGWPQQLGADFSRSRVQALIRQGAVERRRQAGRRAQAQAGGRRRRSRSTCPSRSRPSRKGEDIPLDILYEDADLIVINKPAGPGRPSRRRQLDRHAGQCADPSLRRQPVGHRRRQAAGHRPPPRQGNQRRHGRRQDRPRAPRAVGGLCRSRPDRRPGARLCRAGLGRARTQLGHDRRAARPRRRPRHAAPSCRRTATTPATPSPTTRCSSASARSRTRQRSPRWSNAGWKPAAPTRSASTWPISAIRVVGDPDYGQAFRTKANRLPEPLRDRAKDFPRQALHAQLLAFSPSRHPGEMMRFEAPMPADMAELVDGFREALEPSVK